LAIIDHSEKPKSKESISFKAMDIKIVILVVAVITTPMPKAQATPLARQGHGPSLLWWLLL
jgi:hypothetical protein